MIPIKLSASCPGKHQQQQQQQPSMQLSGGNPRLNQLCARWQQVWLLALDRQRKLNDSLDRQEEVTPFYLNREVRWIHYKVNWMGNL